MGLQYPEKFFSVNKNKDSKETTRSIVSLLQGMWGHLSRKRKIQTGFLFCVTILSALSEVVSLGAVIPFIGVITAPEIVFKYQIVSQISSYFDINSPEELILPITILFCVAALVAGAIRALLLWLSTRLAFAGGSDLSIELYRRTLDQPYQVHVSRNTSEVISGIVSKLHGVITWVLFPVLAMINSVFLLIAVLLTLILINPGIAFMAILGFGMSYLLVMFISRKRLVKNDQDEAFNQTQVVKALQEGLGGIRDVLLNGTQAVYCDIYSKSDRPLRSAQGNNIFIGQSPRYAMEAFGMILIAMIAFSLSKSFNTSTSIAGPLQMLGVLAFAAQRLLPALQQIYNGWSAIIGHKTSINDVLDLLDQPVDTREEVSQEPIFPFDDVLKIQDVSFRYNPNSPIVIDNLNLTIAQGSRVGFVGTTGGGKSTALDLIMGLLEPTKGKILIDGLELGYDNVRSWQKNISHVPQNIYLADSSFTENIAFGVPLDEINFELVKTSAEKAQIANFIESKIDGYETSVGERGILLSGGQRQRVGIARALYRKASVLVFDEATSALDNTTEKAVMDSIITLDKNLTIILIAHRLTTVQNCDMIIEMNHGKVVAQGTYDELMEESQSFRSLAKDSFKD